MKDYFINTVLCCDKEIFYFVCVEEFGIWVDWLTILPTLNFLLDFPTPFFFDDFGMSLVRGKSYCFFLCMSL